MGLLTRVASQKGAKTMEYRQLGKWGVKVSVIGLGSYLTLGQDVSESEGQQIIKKAYEAGVNFFDTANVYGKGAAEEALAKLLSGFRRDSYVLATKVWGPMGPGPNDRGLSRKHIFEQCHASLKRLNTDYLDLYQCHRYDPGTPLEETARAMSDLITQGKIHYWGVSEWTAAQIDAVDTYCRSRGLHPPASNQPRYSLLWRFPEKEVFPLCQTKGIGQVVFSPLAHGVLTGKYKVDQPPPAGSRGANSSQNAIMMRMYYLPELLEKVAAMAQLAGEMGVKPSQLALAWALLHPAVSSVITGATKTSQLEENLRAADLKIDSGAAKKLTELFPVPLQAPAAP